MSKERSTRALVLGGIVVAAILIAASPARASSGSQRNAILVLSTSTSTGSQASTSPAARAIREPFEDLGIRFVQAGALPAGAGPGQLVSDSSALEMATKAGVDICVVAAAVVVDKGAIRATPLQAHQAQFRIRVLDVKTGAALVEKRTERFAYDKDPVQGRARAVTGAIARLGADFSRKLRSHWPPSTQAGASSVVRITGAQGWRPVAAILKQLAASKGIKFVHALEIQDSQIRLTVSTTMSSGSLVALLQRTRIHNGSVAVVSAGNTITMTVRMSPVTSLLGHG